MQRYIEAFSSQVQDWLDSESTKPVFEIVDFKRYDQELPKLRVLFAGGGPPSASAADPPALSFATSFVSCLASTASIPPNHADAFRHCLAATIVFHKMTKAIFEEREDLDAVQGFYVLLLQCLKLAKQSANTAKLDEGLRGFVGPCVRMCNKSQFRVQASLLLLQVCTTRLACVFKDKRYTYALSSVIVPAEGASLSRDFVPSLQEARSGQLIAGSKRAKAPKSVYVSFCFYYGVLALHTDELRKAECLLTMAFKLCHHNAAHNMRRIAFYLIPLKLRLLKYPSIKFLRQTRLLDLYGPVMLFLINGDVPGFRKFMDTHRVTMLRFVSIQIIC